MKKILLIITAVGFFSYTGISQSVKETTDTVSSEYIPVEGRSETGVPKELQGTWVLTSGIKKTKPNIDLGNKKLAPGTETRRDSVTRTTTVNGETRTTTEVNIERIATPEKQITPPQKDNMHKAERPSISFYGLNETFSGFTGCNKYSGRYKITGNKIILLDGAASTKMVCIGEYDEKDFLNTLKKVNSFRTNNGKLELMDGNDVLLAFSRK
ncbi:MAG: lipase [Segetibacter sp.]|nr:lipase [Segetibacter sp.]